VHANNAVQNTLEQNKVGGRGYYGGGYVTLMGETLLRLMGGFITFEGRLSHGGDYIS